MEEPFSHAPGHAQSSQGEHGWRPPSGAPEVPREEGSRVSSGSGGGGRGSDRPKFTVRSVLPAPPAQMKGTHLWGQGRQTAQQANLSRASLGFWSCSLRQGPPHLPGGVNRHPHQSPPGFPHSSAPAPSASHAAVCRQGESLPAAMADTNNQMAVPWGSGAWSRQSQCLAVG